ncbi:hypothetical protein L6R52_40735, partial [Myxococcota bacterium]|nr:hypothetical protein [Myxococcota bacterium]
MTLRDLAWFLLGAALATLVVSRVVRPPRETAVVAPTPVPRDSLAGSTGLADELTRALQRVSAAPQDPRAWITLGDAQAAFEELDAAEHAYRTALRIRPDGLAFA